MNEIEQITRMLSAIDAVGRRYVFRVLENEIKRVQKARRPALRLVPCGPAMPSAEKRQQVEAV